MAERPAITDLRFAQHFAILNEYYVDNTTLTEATEALAFISLTKDSDWQEPDDSEGPLSVSWAAIIISPREQPEYQTKLSELLASLARRLDVRVEKDSPLKVHDMQVWSDLPTFGWEMNYEWNGLSFPAEPSQERDEMTARFVNINKFTALLIKTRLPVFDFSLFALWAMRTALETPLAEQPGQLDAFLPAAAALIEVLGAGMYGWDQEFESGELIGRPGSGGPLWKEARQGFNKARWAFWRRRFGDVAEDGSLSEDVRAAASLAQKYMERIEREAA